ncbi:universal stress protein [Salinarchaeum laminariae]|uniref:universal stress protein n=1 Tax=Salinarchaeum laminariae TaxID=869888 RepID=UPI0020C06668|nr:universal stress protein [Salinarchaeum laminariae]
MVSRVLVPMDDSEMAAHALEYAIETHPDAAITVLHVVGEPSSMMGRATALALSDDPEETGREFAENVLQTAREIAEEHGISIDTKVTMGHPIRAVLNAADEYDAIVVGSHSGSLADRLIVGNVAETIVRQSPVPVTVVR